MEIYVYFLNRTVSNIPKRTPVATVTTPQAETEGQPGGDEEEEVVMVEDEPVPSTSTARARELQETPKPASKPDGKRKRDKSDWHNRIFDFLEKDVPDDSPLDLQFMSMAKRVKLELPSTEWFSLAIKLAGQVDSYIDEYSRKKLVANTFLAPTSNQINVNAQGDNLQMPAARPPPLIAAHASTTATATAAPRQTLQSAGTGPLALFNNEDNLFERVLGYHQL